MKKILLSLLVLSSVAHSSEYDALLESSTAIVDKINTGILLVGSASEYAHHGDALSDGTMSTTAHISEDRKSTRLNSSHSQQSRMPSSA